MCAALFGTSMYILNPHRSEIHTQKNGGECAHNVRFKQKDPKFGKTEDKKQSTKKDERKREVRVTNLYANEIQPKKQSSHTHHKL